MALAVRLLGRRRLLPPPLAGAVAHLSAATQSPSHHHQNRLPPPAPTLPLPPLVLPPFAVPARSFSWYSRSAPGPGPDAAEAPFEGACTEKESIYLDGVHIVDDGKGAASAVGAAADAVGEAAATADGVVGVSGLATSTVVDLIDGFHSLTGLPWWITISLSTVAMRLSILPALTLQLQKTAKIGELFRKLPPPLPPPLSGRSFRDQFSLFQKKRKELGCPSFLWNFAYFSVQFPCFILWMMSIRSMCLNNHPGFDNGGTLWFHNLTEFPHGALGPVFPILVAGLHYLNVQISFQGSQIKNHPGIFGLLAKYYKIYLDILAIPLFLIAYVVPQGSLVYWTTNGLFSVAQQLSLRNNAVRKKLGLPDTRGHLGYRAEKSPTPNFILEGMEGNISESSSPEELLEQALQYFGTGRRDQAIPLIRTAIEKNPDLCTALIGMGQTLFSNRLFPEAAECFEHAIPKIQEHDPLLVLAHFGAGISHERQGDNEMAIKLLQRLAELKEPEKPINKTCYFSGMVLLGSILSKEGRNSEAAKYLRMAIAYDPSIERLLKECEEGIDDQTKSAEQ
ncbi:ALBINO3-like protein 2, chloroplastic [Phragmites australis]|uniref:ALBINO3-like protein 2, chloroplastic n=1 Tax=Phragmites australis TaxID=29695 RepID=UPI002D78D9EA|nr:ALBINO3-like protein 2, chloroplastic [Phragmites australis]